MNMLVFGTSIASDWSVSAAFHQNFVVSFLGFLVWLIIPVFCIYMYLRTRLTGLLVIASGFILKEFLYVVLPSLLVIYGFQGLYLNQVISVIGNISLSVLFVYGVLFLVRMNKKEVG